MIKIEEIDTKLWIYTPYNKDLITVWKRLNGKWNPKKICWGFPSDLKQEIEDVLYDFYGYKDNKIEVADIVIELQKNINYGVNLYINGIPIINDYQKLDHNCAILSNSAIIKTKKVYFDSDTKILIRNFPKNNLDLVNFPYTIRNEKIINCENTFDYLKSLKRIEYFLYNKINFKKIRKLIIEKEFNSFSEYIKELENA